MSEMESEVVEVQPTDPSDTEGPEFVDKEVQDDDAAPDEEA